MKKFAIFAVVALIGVMFYVSQRNENINITSYDTSNLEWCDSIYHQNIGCPKRGQVEIPPVVLAKQEADHLAWCDKIGHRNVGCPDYKR